MDYEYEDGIERQMYPHDLDNCDTMSYIEAWEDEAWSSSNCEEFGLAVFFRGTLEEIRALPDDSM